MSYTVKDILTLQVAPALGCTEPVAIALGAAAAASLLDRHEIDEIEVSVDPNIYKNGLAVSIPGTGGLSGLDMAAAIGALAGDPALKLEVLESVNENDVPTAQKIIKAGRVKVNLLADHRGLHIETRVKAGGDYAESLIRGLHDNIVSLSFNGQPVTASELLSESVSAGTGSPASALETWLKTLSLGQLIKLLDDLDDADMVFLQSGVDANMALAGHGLKFGPGLGIGLALERLARQKLISRDMILEARILASGAADARMAGVKLPAMSSAGSGNHGLTAILPIWAVKKWVDCTEETTLRAIGLSHLITAYVKAHTGRLTAVCGCSVAAGAGAAAGVAYLLGGDQHQIAGAIKNLTVDLAGIICDGAKGGCALKLATAAGTAVQSALFALQGVNVKSTDGIVGLSPEQTMKNVGTLSTEGMIETDRTILKIMLEKQFSD
ncbi:MAG: serine dehydratase subunit alpha family protein [Desulfobacterales bacterium]|nr:serine dehydratase subunit alpha family protein [Desulfobacterales bacterium]